MQNTFHTRIKQIHLKKELQIYPIKNQEGFTKSKDDGWNLKTHFNKFATDADVQWAANSQGLVWIFLEYDELTWDPQLGALMSFKVNY